MKALAIALGYTLAPRYDCGDVSQNRQIRIAAAIGALATAISGLIAAGIIHWSLPSCWQMIRVNAELAAYHAACVKAVTVLYFASFVFLTGLARGRVIWLASFTALGALLTGFVFFLWGDGPQWLAYVETSVPPTCDGDRSQLKPEDFVMGLYPFFLAAFNLVGLAALGHLDTPKFRKA